MHRANFTQSLNISIFALNMKKLLYFIIHKSGDLVYASEQVLMHSILYVKCPILDY